jgi:hypothetical protein
MVFGLPFLVLQHWVIGVVLIQKIGLSWNGYISLLALLLWVVQ